MNRLLAAVLLLGQMQAAAPLRVGDMLPAISGETLAGTRLALPEAAAGKPAVITFSFSREGGRDGRAWGERLSKEFGETIVSFSVVALESVPRLLRPMVVSGVRNGFPPAIRGRAILLYRDEAVWKKLLDVANERCAYLLLLDAGGRIRRIAARPFTEAALPELNAAIRALLAQRR